MKKNKGFTLIELLAVIVILAVIALIATPMILGVIDTAKKGATESSALGYIDAVEKSMVLEFIDAETTGATSTPTGIYTVADLDTVDVKGESPTSGWIYINSSGVIVASQLKFDSYAKTVRYNGKKAYADVDTLDAEPSDLSNAQSLVATSH
ncbi:MAG: type II secretion system protein [Bacilli bacterium]